jgi:hypothetical protein
MVGAARHLPCRFPAKTVYSPRSILSIPIAARIDSMNLGLLFYFSRGAQLCCDYFYLISFPYKPI